MKISARNVLKGKLNNLGVSPYPRNCVPLPAILFGGKKEMVPRF